MEEKIEKERGITINTSHVDIVSIGGSPLRKAPTKVFIAKEKKVLEDEAAASEKKRPRGSLAAFADALVNLSQKDVQGLAKILEEEYGIVAERNAASESAKASTIRLKLPKPDYYVPKKSGKIHSKPKGFKR